MPIDKLAEKAKKIAKSNRIERITSDAYNVVGDHGTYTVAKDFNGKFSCNCPGFLQKGRCSHILAVQLSSKKGF